MGGITFQLALAAAVMAGTKTVTRRVCSDNPRSPWWRDRCALTVGRDYAIQPGRGRRAIGRAIVVSVARQRLGVLDRAETRREGFPSREAFEKTFAGLNSGYDPAVLVWRIELCVPFDTPLPRLPPGRRCPPAAADNEGWRRSPMDRRPIQVGDPVWLPTPLADCPDRVAPPGLREQALALEAEITAEPGRVVSIEAGWAMVDRGPWGQFGHRGADLRLVEPCCDMHNAHCEPAGDLCCEGCAEASHDTFPIRHADGTRCVLAREQGGAVTTDGR